MGTEVEGEIMRSIVLFTLEPLQNFYLGIQKIFKDGMVSYLSSNSIIKNVSNQKNETKLSRVNKECSSLRTLCANLFFLNRKQTACCGSGNF